MRSLPRSPPRALLSAASRVLRVAGLMTFLWLFARGVDWPAAAAILERREAAGWFAAGVLAYASGQVFGGLGWRALVRAHGRDVSVPEMLQHDLSSVFWSTILPGGVAGEVVKGVRLTLDGKSYDNSTISPGAGDIARSLVIARFVSGTMACALALTMVPFADFPHRGAAALAIGATAAVCVGGLVVVRLGSPMMARFLPSVAARLPAGRFPSAGPLTVAAAGSLACHGSFAVVYAMAFRVGGVPLSVPDAALFAALSSCVEALPISVGGFGLREWTVSRLGATLFAPVAANAASLALAAMVALAVGSGGLVELGRVRRAGRELARPPA